MNHRDHQGRFTRPTEIVAIERLQSRQAAAAARIGLHPHPPAPATSEPGPKRPSLDGGVKPAAPIGRSADTEQASRNLAQARSENVPLADALGAFLGEITQ